MKFEIEILGDDRILAANRVKLDNPSLTMDELVELYKDLIKRFLMNECQGVVYEQGKQTLSRMDAKAITDEVNILIKEV